MKNRFTVSKENDSWCVLIRLGDLRLSDGWLEAAVSEYIPTRKEARALAKVLNANPSLQATDSATIRAAREAAKATVQNERRIRLLELKRNRELSLDEADELERLTKAIDDHVAATAPRPRIDAAHRTTIGDLYTRVAELVSANGSEKEIEAYLHEIQKLKTVFNSLTTTPT